MLELWRQEISIKDLIKPKASEVKNTIHHH
jgi:hypothetical protein